MKMNSSFCTVALITLAMAASAADRQALHGHVPEAVAHLNLQPIGRLPGTNRLDLIMGLPLRNPELRTKLFQEIYDPRSTNYHHYSTPLQFMEMFGPTKSDYEALTRFVSTNGLTVVRTHPDYTLLNVRASVSDIEKVFHVTMRVYQHPIENRTFFAPDVDPSLDLAVPVLYVTGLNNYLVPHPTGILMPADGSVPSGYYLGADFRKAYAPRVSLTGAGQVVGLLELQGYYASDVTNYQIMAGLTNIPVPPIRNVLVDNFNGTDGNSGGEAPGDIEMVISMAPGLSQLNVYEAPGPPILVNGYGTGDWLDILDEMAYPTQGEPLPRQLSSSWILGNNPNADQYYQEFGIQGQSFFQASGDHGAYYWGILGIGDIAQWADDTNVTIVGGTALTTSSDGSWMSETTWNDGYDSADSEYWASGGGISSHYPLPDWQQGVNMMSKGGSTSMRNVPDVSMVADSIWVIFNDGASTWGRGTSFATPLWAGFMALVNQQAEYGAKPAAGFINPAIYSVGEGLNYSNDFHDIADDSNNGNSESDFNAVTGYDLCTGWGTPTGSNLINALSGFSPASPSMSTEPRSQTAMMGSTATFTVLANGFTPLSIRWYQNTSPLASGGRIYIVNGPNTGGVDSSTLTISNVTAGDDASYFVVVTNFVGSITSSVAILTVTNSSFTTNSLVVDSSNPGSGVSIIVAPNDATGAGTGTTPFIRSYTNAAQVTLTAPSTAYGNDFQEWQANGVAYTTSLSATITMNATYTMTAIFSSPPSATYTVNITSSNPGSGVSIGASPNDNNGKSGGTTPFTLTYNSNTTVTLTAPAKEGDNAFYFWQLDGENWANAQGLILAVDGNYSLNAAYGGIAIIALSGNLTFGNVQTGAQEVREFTIQSQGGNQDLQVSSIACPPGFSLSWSNGMIPLYSSTNVYVTFAPTTTTSYSTNLTVYCDATVGSSTIPISGTGIVVPPPSGVPFSVSAFETIYSIPYSSTAQPGPWPFGDNPVAGLVQDSSGYLYGTTPFGGEYGNGVVFRITPSGANPTLFYTFPNGGTPNPKLMLANDGNLYCTTYVGGADGNGSVLKITSGGYPSTFFSFSEASDGSGNPVSPLIQGMNGDFYGTAYWGLDGGSAFVLTASAGFTLLNDFDTSQPGVGFILIAPLIQGTDGNLYGTTFSGGTNNSGTVFKLTQSGTLTPLYSFTGGTDGGNPQAGLAQDKGGYLYGTTSRGGTFGDGTVFKMTTNGNIIWSIPFNGTNGSNGGYGIPFFLEASLIQATDGHLYGVAPSGGVSGDGTVFQITTNGILTVLHSFNGSDGAIPFGLMQARDGNLYGTTYQGGTDGGGVVFRAVIPLALLSCARAGNSISITCSAVPGQTYQLQYTTDLSQSNWITSISAITATAPTITASDALGPDGHRFYRIVLTPQAW